MMNGINNKMVLNLRNKMNFIFFLCFGGYDFYFRFGLIVCGFWVVFNFIFYLYMVNNFWLWD